MRRRSKPGWLILGLLALLSFSSSQDMPPVGLAAQLKTGETTYFLACAMCHGDRLEGVSAPPLSGEGFTSTYGNMPVSRLTSFIAEQMPHGAPSTLTDQEVLAVTAYLLHENHAKRPDLALNQATLDTPVQFSGENP